MAPKRVFDLRLTVDERELAAVVAALRALDLEEVLEAAVAAPPAVEAAPESSESPAIEPASACAERDVLCVALRRGTTVRCRKNRIAGSIWCVSHQDWVNRGGANCQ